MEELKSSHMLAAKRILRYVKGTVSHGLFYSSSNLYQLEGYSDSDWGRDYNDQKSTT